MKIFISSEASQGAFEVMINSGTTLVKGSTALLSDQEWGELHHRKTFGKLHQTNTTRS